MAAGVGRLTPLTAYLAADGFAADLVQELAGTPIMREHGRLLLTEGAAVPAAWAANIWHDARILPIASIGEGAKALRAIQRNWWP
jgi:23S rRNA (cytidine2498-2'-O)-methyltransferase